MPEETLESCKTAGPVSVSNGNDTKQIVVSVQDVDESTSGSSGFDPNIIDGGTGIDKLISYEGVGSDYTITRYGDGWTVIVGPGINSSTITQRVRDVEIFLPNDGAIDLTSLSIQSGTGGPSSGGASGGGGANHYDVIGPMYVGFGGS